MKYTTKNNMNTRSLVLCGLFAGIISICSIITIPLGFTPIPINFGTFAIFLAGGILGKKYGTISVLIFVLLGGIGLPVFSGFKGGLGVLVGPTGGYIIGYILAAFLIGLIIDSLYKKKALQYKSSSCFNMKKNKSKLFIICILASTIGLIACYTLGTLWFVYSTKTGVVASLTACVFPFIPGDIVKILLSSIILTRLPKSIFFN